MLLSTLLKESTRSPSSVRCRDEENNQIPAVNTLTDNLRFKFPLVTPVSPCYPCYPCYPLFPIVTPLTPCDPLFPLLPLVTLCYPLLPFVPHCYPLLPL